MSEPQNTPLPEVSRADVLPLPAGWIPLAPSGSDHGEWADAYLDGLPAEPNPAAKEQLRFGLVSVMAMAAQMRPGTRYSFALVEDPMLGMVKALLSVQMLRVTPDAFDAYRSRLTETNSDGGVEVINRTVQDVEFSVGRGVVMHDFTLEPEAAAVPDPALERAILGLFVADSDVMIEFSLYAQDLVVFDDMVDYLVTIVAQLDISGVKS